MNKISLDLHGTAKWFEFVGCDVSRPQKAPQISVLEAVRFVMEQLRPEIRCSAWIDTSAGSLGIGYIQVRLLSASGVVGLAHATRPATRALSRALPRRRALCTNWKKPRERGSLSCDMPRCGRSQERSKDQNPSMVLM